MSPDRSSSHSTTLVLHTVHSNLFLGGYAILCYGTLLCYAIANNVLTTNITRTPKTSHTHLLPTGDLPCIASVAAGTSPESHNYSKQRAPTICVVVIRLLAVVHVAIVGATHDFEHVVDADHAPGRGEHGGGGGDAVDARTTRPRPRRPCRRRPPAAGPLG